MALQDETVLHLAEKYFGRGDKDLYDREIDAYRIAGQWLSGADARKAHGEEKLEAVRVAMEVAGK